MQYKVRQHHPLLPIRSFFVKLGIFVLLLCSINQHFNNQQVSATYYNTDWTYKQSITVDNSGSAATNEDVLVTMDTATLVSNSKLQSDCGDLRFIDSDDSTELDYWIEDGCNTASTKIWVRIPSLPSGGKTIYVYYGNNYVGNGGLIWSGNVYMYADTTCPSGWTRASDLDNKFLYGSSTYGTTGGADTNTHSNATCTSTSISTTNVSGTVGAPVYQIHTFTSSGTFVASQNLTVEVLVVGGGGGGGQEVGGGGGGGGVVQNSSYSVTAGSVSVTVGNGGAGVSTSVRAGNGGNSVFGSITAIGGGGGGDNDQYTGGTGGSGGGGGCSTNGGSGTSGQGTAGSNGSYGSWPNLGAGGGGGAVNPGQPAFTWRAGDGGAGYYSIISGTGKYYGGGGGGGAGYVVSGGTGGLGGGGNGTGAINTAGTNGATNTGGGGGGGGADRAFTSASGGSGIVIVRYASSTAKATGGTITTQSYNYPSISTTHTHNNLTSSINSSSSLASYKNIVVCYNNKFTLPSGLISLFLATVPSGWTRFSALDNVLPRAASSYGATGGSNTHTHSTTGSTTTATGETVKTAIPLITAGGTKTTSGGYTIHTFTAGTYRSNSSFYTSAPLNIEVLVVAGGGAGGQELGGGGGGGGVRYSSSYNVSAGSTPVIVGIGGKPQNSYTGTANTGENSVFGSLTATGGGGGGSASAGSSGGSGGGGGVRNGIAYAPGAGTSGQGNSGGYGSAGGWPALGAGGGGGGGASGVTGTTSKAGNGGAGFYSAISGTGTYYGGGGGGGAGTSTTIGYGGAGGGGNGNNAIGSPGVAGTANTGGGGGGGGSSGSYYNAAGGSGIVIVRYLTPTKTIASATHTHTTSSATTGAGANIPPYITAIFGKANSSIYANENNILMASSVPPLGWNRISAFDNKFVMGSSAYGTTGGATTHTHTVTNTTGAPSATISVITNGTSYFADSTHTHSCSVTSSSASNIPTYSSVIYMQRKVSKTTTVNPNSSPYAPSSLLTEGATNPSLVTDPNPEFSAVFSDPDSDDTGSHYQIQVNTAPDFSGTIMWDSGQQSMSALANGARSSDISYAGIGLALNGYTFYWRIRFWDSFYLVGPWSNVQNFSTNNIPNTPTLDSPIQGDTNVFFRPVLLTTGRDIDIDYLRYKIELCTDLAMTTNCQTFDQTTSQTGWSGQDVSGTAYSSGTQATYTLQSDLAAGITYYWRSYAADPAGTNTWSATQATPRHFTTLPTPLPADACFVQESIDDSQLLVVWTDNANNEDYYEVQRSVDGGAWSVLQTSLAANTVNLLDSTVSTGHTYQYRIAPYFSTGPTYAAWCTASQLNLGLGLFNLEGIKASSLKFN